jgi:hypothetical protein
MSEENVAAHNEAATGSVVHRSESRRWIMLRRLAWVVILAAVAVAGCMSASGAVRGTP